MTSETKTSRRGFLKIAATTAVGTVGFPYVVQASALGRDGKVAASNRITMAFIGTGNQGTNDMRVFLGDERVQVVAVCDVNKESSGYWDGAVGGREPAKLWVEQAYADQKASGTYKGCDTYADFREVLARKDIDAVEVAVPDHWHAYLAISAAKAGKDIYCQKPLGLTIADGRAMSNAVHKYKRIFQTGSQQRSDKNFRRACELVRNGRIGKLTTVRCGLPGGRPDYGHTGDHKKPEPVPEGFDYETWLGPAPQAEYAPARCFVNFRWIYDYSGGQVTDWGGHHPDCAQWGMGTEYTGPVEIRNAKAEFPPDPLWNTATEYYFEAIYKDGVKLIVSNKERGGVTWEGTDGWVWADRGQHDASSKEILNSVIGPNEIHLYESDNHYRNFIDCVISKKEPIAPVEVAHRSITICHLGNIAMRLGRNSLKWDPEKEHILDDPEASKMLSRPYRAPWKLPS
ncbi:MAG: Myo-inositol 2-dehydrogenase [Chthonomonadaceae bacterium]|nr:Myo-inositol 2-dehydrogenase [Chthonomonadaceae bacterium]